MKNYICRKVVDWMFPKPGAFSSFLLFAKYWPFHGLTAPLFRYCVKHDMKNWVTIGLPGGSYVARKSK